MVLQAHQYTLPSSWACYLINGDDSGISAEDKEAADKFIDSHGLDWPVGCEDAGFRRIHDAWNEMPLAGDCQTYTFLVQEN